MKNSMITKQQLSSDVIFIIRVIGVQGMQFLRIKINFVYTHLIRNFVLSVENRLHWHLDVLLGEDANMTTDRVALGNLGLIKKMVLSLYKLVQPMLKKDTSIRRVRKKFGRDFKSALALLLSLDEKTIREALEKAKAKK